MVPKIDKIPNFATKSAPFGKYNFPNIKMFKYIIIHNICAKFQKS